MFIYLILLSTRHGVSFVTALFVQMAFSYECKIYLIKNNLRLSNGYNQLASC